MNLRRIYTIATVAAIAGGGAQSAPVSGYYDSCNGKTGDALLKELHEVIDNHTNVGYDGLWEVYADSDVYPEDGKIWDMYSTKHWPLNSEKCGNYKSVGDCYNREHSLPKSWFSERSPMKSDAFHVYPTDGKVNGQRSNYPYGECAGGVTLGSSGSVRALGRCGKSTTPGYSGTVFEPDDEYKGDFARTYFYMAARYNDVISSWSSDALAGNSYPVFKTWQLDVLLKWHRQDPVSNKELDRNDAVYRHQRNRNPFIDHPELAEYIWGDRKGEAWDASGVTEPMLSLPVNGSAVDMGVYGVNVTRTATVNVKGANIKGNLTLTVSGDGFTVTPSTVSASQANTGTTATVYVLATQAGTHTGTLVISGDGISSTVTFSGTAVTGIPVDEAVNVSDHSFTARWANILDGIGATYSLDVRRDGVSIEGYPRDVQASAESHEVTGLDAATTYTYTVSSGTLTSREVSVTTAEPLPWIDLLFDGDLSFVCDPGEPSEVAELLVDVENITDDITIRVEAPFEVSTDRSTWTQTLTILAEEERFYMRLNATQPGTYTTTVSLSAGDYVNDNFEATGTTRSLEPTFVEDFEAEWIEGTPPTNWGPYVTTQYRGTAGLWDLHNIGMYGDVHSGSQALRFYNKTGESWAATAENRTTGIGTVTFYAKAWKPTEQGAMDIEVSVDNGKTWKTYGAVDLYGTSDYEQYTVTVNESRPARVRFNRTSDGGRIRLDDVTISDYYASDLIADTDYHRWDAYCRDGRLVVTVADDSADLLVYSADGIIRYDGAVASGTTVIDTLPAGIYIVAIGDFTRVVAIR